MKNVVLITRKEILKDLIIDYLNGMISMNNSWNHLLNGGFKGFKNIKEDFMKKKIIKINLNL